MSLFLAYGPVVLLICVLAFGRWRIALAALTLAVAYWAGSEIIGRPKPVQLAFLESAQEAIVAGAHYVEGEAIWLWLILPGEDAPRAYALPWSRQAAEQMQQAKRGAEEADTALMLRDPFGDMEFHPAPQPAMPEKGTE